MFCKGFRCDLSLIRCRSHGIEQRDLCMAVNVGEASVNPFRWGTVSTGLAKVEGSQPR